LQYAKILVNQQRIIVSDVSLIFHLMIVGIEILDVKEIIGKGKSPEIVLENINPSCAA